MEGPIPEGMAPPPRRRARAAALIVGALVLLAAFMATAPYLSSALRQEYSQLPGSETTTSYSNTNSGTQYNASTSTTQCSSEVNVQPLVNPDIINGSANIAYPPDYCTLALYALGLINQDRAANGTGPVTLDYNRAAQQHADSMSYHNYFSHFDTQGLKPYMRYSMLGGVGADFENVAYSYYSIPHYLSTSTVEGAIQQLEHSMIYNDSACCNNGHRYNILNPLHNKVSIGVTYTSTTVYFDEEFENNYINLNLTVAGPASSNPYYVTMTGTPIQGTPAPTAVYVAFDPTPSSETSAQLDSGPHEYGPGTLEGGVLPPAGLFGSCGQFASGTTVCADVWKFSNHGVDIAFPLSEFIRNYGPGVYTLYMVTGYSTDTALTSISVFVSS